MNHPPSDVLVALTPVVDLLEQLDVRYHIGGSLADSAYGMPRASADVDLVADLRPEHVDTFVERLQADYYVDRNRVHEAIRQRRSFNLIHLYTTMKIDVFVPESVRFAQQEQARARPETLDVTPNARVFFLKSPEDLVLRKLHWYRDGGEVSERQWSDVVGVLKVQGEGIDRDYLDHWAAVLGIDNLLKRAIAAADAGRN